MKNNKWILSVILAMTLVLGIAVNSFPLLNIYAAAEENISNVDAEIGASDPTEANATFVLTVIDGSGSGSYAPGTVVPIVAHYPPPYVQVFDQWIADNDGSFANADNSVTSFIMPEKAVTVKASYRDSTAFFNTDVLLPTPLY